MSHCKRRASNSCFRLLSVLQGEELKTDNMNVADICPFHNLPYDNCICGEYEDFEEVTPEGVKFFGELDAKTDRTEEEEEYWRILRRLILKGNVVGEQA
jgi:hypothetical protein